MSSVSAVPTCASILSVRNTRGRTYSESAAAIPAQADGPESFSNSPIFRARGARPSVVPAPWLQILSSSASQMALEQQPQINLPVPELQPGYIRVSYIITPSPPRFYFPVYFTTNAPLSIVFTTTNPLLNPAYELQLPTKSSDP